jgi:hypothetical protein
MTQQRAGINGAQRSDVQSGPEVALLRVFAFDSRKDCMNPTMNPAAHAVEYRFVHHPARQTCPLCNQQFETRIGSWPHLAGTDSAVCGRGACPVGDDVTGPPPCDTLFAFPELDAATLDAIRRTDAELSVPERLRAASLDEKVPADDRRLLQCAVIDLLFWEADTTRINSLEPSLTLCTSAQAAAELLLSGCGDIV